MGKSAPRSDLRRQEVRRQRSEARGTLWQNISRRIHPRVLLVWTAFFLAVALILLAGNESMPWRLLQRVDRDITARVEFTLEDAVQTQQARQRARAEVPDRYVANDEPVNAVRRQLKELADLAVAAQGDADALIALAKEKGRTLSPAAAAALLELVADQKDYDSRMTRLADRLEAEYLVEEVNEPNRPDRPKQSLLSPLDGPVLRVETASLLVLPASVPEKAREVIRKTSDAVASAVFAEPLQPVVADMIARTLAGPDGKSPVALWRYDSAATMEAVRAAAEAVEPVTITVKVGDKLVPVGTVLSERELDLLKREHEEYQRAEQIDPELWQRKLLYESGVAVLVLIVTVGLAAYTALYEDRVFQRPARALGLAALMLLMLGLARLIELAEYPADLAVEFSVGLLVIAASLLTIAYNQRFAFGGAGALAALMTLASRGDFGLFLTLMAAMGVTVFSLREVRTRSKIVAVGALAGLAAMVTSAATGFVSGGEVKYVVTHAVVAGASALMGGFIVQGILPNFERIFGVATSMTLLEWCDASRPLLRRLAQQAPGTYSHSLVLSQMAEEAASSIGANGLLTRVGALYHDIGKTQKADYFVENQEARINRHDRLSPTMSLLIIVGHVKDGVEMAKAYGLPRVLHQFIAEHHGTTVVRYFHRAACEAEATARTKRFCDRDVPESEFRYHGPKPRSKESAILMLCDGCEGAVRALSEPTPGRIESAVHEVVMDRLNDGQFDDCEITLRELNMVERSLVKSLCAIHHGRIKYPKGPPTSARPAMAGAAGRSGNGEEEPALQDVTAETPEVVRQA